MCLFPAQANDGVTVDQTQSFYVGGECGCLSHSYHSVNFPMSQTVSQFWLKLTSSPFSSQPFLNMLSLIHLPSFCKLLKILISGAQD